MSIDLSNIFSEGYGIVPKKLMLSDLDIETKAILCLMLSYTGAGKSECWPSIRKIAHALKISPTTVQDRVKKLISGNVITKRQTRTAGNKRNIYRLSFLPGSEGVPPDDTGVCQEMAQGVPPDDTGVCQEVVHNININNISNNNTRIKKTAKRRTVPKASEKDIKYKPLALLLFEEDQKTSPVNVSAAQKEKKVTSWARDIRLLFESAKPGQITTDLVKNVIKWCKNPDNFPGAFSWVPNIRSGRKLREKFPILLQQFRAWERDQVKVREEEKRRKRLDALHAQGY